MGSATARRGGSRRGATDATIRDERGEDRTEGRRPDAARATQLDHGEGCDRLGERLRDTILGRDERARRVGVVHRPIDDAQREPVAVAREGEGDARDRRRGAVLDSERELVAAVDAMMAPRVRHPG